MKIPRFGVPGYFNLPDLLRSRDAIIKFLTNFTQVFNFLRELELNPDEDPDTLIILNRERAPFNGLSRSVNLHLNKTGNNDSQLNIDRNARDEMETISPAGIIPGHFNWVEDFATTEFKYFEADITGNPDAACGIILKWGGGTTVAGKIYHLNTSGNWALTDGSVATSGTALVAFAMGTDPDVHGMLLKGYARVGTYSHGSPWNPGVPVYISDKTGADGTMSDTIPTASGSVIRVMGFCLSGNATNHERVIWFDPDGSYTTA